MVPLCHTCHGKIHGLDFTNHGNLISQGIKRVMKGRSSWGRQRTEHANPMLVEKVKQLKQEGLSCREIAKETGLSVKTAWRLGKL